MRTAIKFPPVARFRFLPLLLLLTTTAFALDPLPIRVTDAWVRAVPASLTDTAAFMRIVNVSADPLYLTGGSSPIAGMAMPMGTTRKMVQGVEVLGMAGVDSIEIPPHGECLLKPGGCHLMLTNLSSHPHPGDMIQVTLNFEPGHRSLTVQVPAQIDAAP